MSINTETFILRTLLALLKPAEGLDETLRAVWDHVTALSIQKHKLSIHSNIHSLHLQAHITTHSHRAYPKFITNTDSYYYYSLYKHPRARTHKHVYCTLVTVSKFVQCLSNNLFLLLLFLLGGISSRSTCMVLNLLLCFKCRRVVTQKLSQGRCRFARNLFLGLCGYEAALLSHAHEEVVKTLLHFQC